MQEDGRASADAKPPGEAPGETLSSGELSGAVRPEVRPEVGGQQFPGTDGNQREPEPPDDPEPRCELRGYVWKATAADLEQSPVPRRSGWCWGITFKNDWPDGGDGASEAWAEEWFTDGLADSEADARRRAESELLRPVPENTVVLPIVVTKGRPKLRKPAGGGVL